MEQFKCSYCKRNANEEKSIHIVNLNYYICEACFHNEPWSYCDGCGQWFSADHTDEIALVGWEFCNRCRDKYSRECYECAQFFLEEDPVFDKKDKEYYYSIRYIRRLFSWKPQF